MPQQSLKSTILADPDKFAAMLLKYGMTKTAKKLGVSKRTLNRDRRRYLKDYAPPGDCKKYANNYYVYSNGRVWLPKLFRFSAIKTRPSGYTQIRINRKFISLHRIVLTLFDRPPKRGEQGRHLDGNPRHNWISNLKWGTPKQNAADKIRHGTTNEGERHGRAKLNEKHVRILRRRYKSGETDIIARYAARHGMCKTSVWNAVTNRSWQHIH